MDVKRLIIYIPGGKQLQEGKKKVGLIWLIGTFITFPIGGIGIIIYAIYLFLYCKQDLTSLITSFRKSHNNNPQESKRNPYTDQKNNSQESKNYPYADQNDNSQGSKNYPYAENSTGGSVALINDYVMLKRGGFFKFLNFFSTNANELKIPIFNINVVNYKSSGVLDGTLEFVYTGYVPNPKQNKHQQENVITFRGRLENEKFLKFKEIVENRIREVYDESRQPNSVSLSNELTKLNELKEQGILSQEEFEREKRKLIDN